MEEIERIRSRTVLEKRVEFSKVRFRGFMFP